MELEKLTKSGRVRELLEAGMSNHAAIARIVGCSPVLVHWVAHPEKHNALNNAWSRLRTKKKKEERQP